MLRSLLVHHELFGASRFSTLQWWEHSNLPLIVQKRYADGVSRQAGRQGRMVLVVLLQRLQDCPALLAILTEQLHTKPLTL